jgi:hypothetical protein
VDIRIIAQAGASLNLLFFLPLDKTSEPTAAEAPYWYWTYPEKWSIL